MEDDKRVSKYRPGYRDIMILYTCNFSELCDSVDTGFGYRVDPYDQLPL